MPKSAPEAILTAAKLQRWLSIVPVQEAHCSWMTGDQEVNSLLSGETAKTRSGPRAALRLHVRSWETDFPDKYVSVWWLYLDELTRRFESRITGHSIKSASHAAQ